MAFRKTTLLRTGCIFGTTFQNKDDQDERCTRAPESGTTPPLRGQRVRFGTEVEWHWLFRVRSEGGGRHCADIKLEKYRPWPRNMQQKLSHLKRQKKPYLVCGLLLCPQQSWRATRELCSETAFHETDLTDNRRKANRPRQGIITYRHLLRIAR